MKGWGSVGAVRMQERNQRTLPLFFFFWKCSTFLHGFPHSTVSLSQRRRLYRVAWLNRNSNQIFITSQYSILKRTLLLNSRDSHEWNYAEAWCAPAPHSGRISIFHSINVFGLCCRSMVFNWVSLDLWAGPHDPWKGTHNPLGVRMALKNSTYPLRVHIILTKSTWPLGMSI